jgi:hypothetical protein
MIYNSTSRPDKLYYLLLDVLLQFHYALRGIKLTIYVYYDAALARRFILQKAQQRESTV